MSVVAACFGPSGFGAYELEWDSNVPRLQPSNRKPEVLLCPGFMDVHIHGAFGIDWMAASSSEMLSLCEKLSERGYEIFLPTTVSASPQAVSKALANLPEHPMIAGFHLEGPFLSPKYPGAQPPSAIVDPPKRGGPWDPILEDPRLKIVTLAPERPGAIDLIKRLISRGVTASIGHTDATFDQAQKGLEAGARNVTHTFNAMRGFHHREPGTVGFALTNDDVTAELIYDRRHVSKSATELLFKCKPADKVIGVSDSSMATGLPEGKIFRMWGQEVETSSGSVFLKGTQTLAGSAITLLDAFKNVVEDFGPETAMRLCSLNPRKALGLKGLPKLHLILGLDGRLLETRKSAA